MAVTTFHSRCIHNKVRMFPSIVLVFLITFSWFLLTPVVGFGYCSMSDFTEVRFSTHGCKVHTLGQMKVPVRFESQVRLVGVLYFLLPLHELNGDVRGVEVTHVADQDIFFTELSWMTGVHLNPGTNYSQMKRGPESVKVFRDFQCPILCFNKPISLGLQQKI